MSEEREAQSPSGDVHAWLAAKAKTPNEWLRREPRQTHPTILEIVREITAAVPAGRTLYDDDVERQTNDRIGGMPPHSHHGDPDRHALVRQLGHEVYIARKIIRDEENAAAEAALIAEGFAPLADVSLNDGDRILIRLGVVYSGYSVAQYGRPEEARVKLDGNRIVFLPKGARTRYFVPAGPALVKALP